MKKHRKWIACVLVALCFCALCATPAFAVTEDEVQAVVDSAGKEAVSGNIFIWFLCAIAFLKASQKIDSFMSSLGINVGHTGGSMLAEAMIAARGVSAVKGGVGGIKGAFGGGGSGGGGSGDAAAGFMAGGLAGAVGRHFSQSAAGSVTGQAGGFAAGISRKMFNSSLAKGGEFANNVIGSVARGRVASAGTMTGTTAAAAMSSYFGGGQNGAASVTNSSGFDGDASSGVGDAPGVSYGGGSGMDDSDIGVDGGGYVPTAGGFSSDDSSGYVGGGTVDVDSIPTYSDVEIGGGRVTGRETSVSEPEGIDFAMYSMDQYAKPQGDFSVVQAADGSKWYKQYAKDMVDRTPYMDEEGEIKFTEKIIKAVPRPPMRKDRQ